MQRVETKIIRKNKGQYPSVFHTISAEKHFSGKPCRKCNETLRYQKGNQGCVACARKMCRKYYCDNREKINQYSKDYNRNNRSPARRSHLKRAFGITLEQFDALFLSQGNVCAICHSDSPSGPGWHVDHCHASGRIRGILCHGCNLILGHAKDNVARLSACISYLNQHRETEITTITADTD